MKWQWWNWKNEFAHIKRTIITDTTWLCLTVYMHHRIFRSCSVFIDYTRQFLLLSRPSQSHARALLIMTSHEQTGHQHKKKKMLYFYDNDNFLKDYRTMNAPSSNARKGHLPTPKRLRQYNTRTELVFKSCLTKWNGLTALPLFWYDPFLKIAMPKDNQIKRKINLPWGIRLLMDWE